MSPRAPDPNGSQAAPVEVRVIGVVAPLHVGGPEPGRPIEARRRRGRRGLGLALRPDGAIGPHMHLAHRADHAGADQFDNPAAVVAGMALVAHLGDHFRTSASQGVELAAFLDGVGQGFLHEHMQAALHRHARRNGVVMVGG